MLKLNNQQLKSFWQQNRVTILIVGSALILTVFLLAVRAAGPLVTYEAEGANLAGNTLIKSSSAASGGSYVEFAGTITSQVPGRIAVSSDGNFHDRDDIAASAMTIAILAKSGNAGKLVYYGHSDHIWETSASREERMRESVEDTAKMWGGFDLSNIYNAKQETNAAVSALAAEISKSTASNPLWLIGAGPMEVICRAIRASNQSGRQHTKVISHSDWNNSHASEFHNGCHFNDIPGLGVGTIRIIDQNAGTKRAYSEYTWLDNSSDAKLNWLWDRAMVARTDIFDPSDAGMAYWLVTGGVNGGDENSNPTKWKNFFLNDSTPTDPPPPPPPPSGGTVWLEQGGKVAIETESVTATGDWVKESSDAGHSGSGYYVTRGPEYFNQPGNGVLSYQIKISQASNYNFYLHSRRDGSGASDLHNDVWIRLDGGTWEKLFQRGGQHEVWTWDHRVERHTGNVQLAYSLSAGIHTIQISQRSTRFQIDKIHLSTGANMVLTTPESPRQ